MQDLYREHILDHYESPRQNGEIEGADISCERNSPLCGDRIRVYIKLNDAHDAIAEARFTGDGCIISQAAASMLLEDIQGKPLAELESLPPQHVLDLVGATLTAQRVKCALLGLQTVKDGIKEWKAQQGG
jgi:nitrogen fixation protein NifU and related proteins